MKKERLVTEGFSLVEVLLASAIFSAIVAALIGAIIFGQESARTSAERMRAGFLAEEALEAARNIRDEDFAILVDGTHGIAVSGGQWELSGSSDNTDIFTRTLTLGTIDSDTKSAISEVTWAQTPQRSGTVSLETRLTNWLVEGGGGSAGDWSSPSVEGTLNISGINNGWKVQVAGDYAYAVRNGGNPDFLVIDISDTSSPSLAASLSLAGTLRNIAVAGNYAYVASSQNNQELIVVDISTPSSPSQAGSLNLSGNSDLYGVYAVGTTVYASRNSSGQPEFYVISTATPAVPVLLGSLEIGSDSNEVFILGNYAYLATDGDELEVVDVTTPASPSSAGSLNLSGVSNGETITGFTDRVIVGRADGNVHVIDVSTPGSPSNISSYDVGAIARDVDIGNSNTYIFVGSDENSNEFQIIDITDEGSPVFLGGVDTSPNSDINGVAYDSAKDRVVGVGENNSEEIVIFQPAP